MASANYRVSLSRQILDEIALEGLEGVTLPSLWLLLSTSSEVLVSLPQSEQLQQHVWTFILRAAAHLFFYELPGERQTIKIYNRFKNIDPDLGVPVSPNESPNTRYKFVPISDGDIMGSCENYKERKKISLKQICGMSVSAVLKSWGNKFVIVGSQELRYNALTPANVSHPRELTNIQYCIWEAIGRSRYNGETTAGVWSLQHFCKDPTIVFYIKNKLIHHGIVTPQFFNETRNDRLMATTLLTLPRFYPTYRSILAAVIERLFQVLKETPNHCMSMVDARNMFPLFERPKSFKKIVTTHWFRRLFVTTAVPYYEYHNKERKDTNQSAKTVVTVTLRNPNLHIDEIFADDDNQEKSEIAEKFFDEKHTFVDMPVKDEFLRALARHGSRGCSHSELCKYLSMQHITVRQIVKNLMSSGSIKSYCTDVGRQRINRYVASEFADSVNKDKDVAIAVLKNLHCAEEPNIPSNDEVVLADIEIITSRIKPYTYDVSKNMLQRPAFTQRQVSRKELIIKCIDESCIVQVSALRAIIQRHEKERGYKDDVCRKSVRRLLSALSTSNHVRIFEIQLQYEEHVRLYRYVAHPKIDADHDVLKRETLKLKNSLFLILEERRLREETTAKERRKRVLVTVKKAASKANEKKLKIKEKEPLPAPTHKPPKFLISRYMHEFLFYIVVELNDCHPAKEITAEQLQLWQHTEPALQIQEYMEQLSADDDFKVMAYTEDISWRTFIPPLPKYADKPAGWVYFMDVVDRMPLSMFNKIFRIEKGANEHLISYLKHPVRQHYLMRQLPCELQVQISRIHLQKIYTTVLKLLNHMGLVQVGERMNAKDPLIMWVFLNRLAELMDTTSTEPSFSKINTEREYPTLCFEFGSFDDVHRYWSSLQRICVLTKLGFRRGKTGSSERFKELSYLGSVGFDEAPHYDNGKIPGNRLGAAGFSENLFAHTFRNWSWVLHGNSKPKVIRSSVARTNKHARLSQHHRKNRSHMPPPRRLPAISGVAAVKRISVKKSGARDAIDRDALKNMRTLRVAWSKDEDSLLKLSRAVYMYVAAPVPALGLLTVGKICRDIIRHNLGIFNKTSQACVRRANFIVKQNRHVPEVPTWLHMLQTSEYAQRKYGDNFLQKLKQSYSNRVEYCDALTLHFILLMSYLYKRIHNTDANSSLIPRFLIPDSVSEFKRKFRERPAVIDEQSIQFANPVSEFDLQIILVNSVLHSSLCCTRDKTLYNLQAFEIYKNFPEEVLHAAFTKARSDGLVVAIKRKNIQLVPSLLAGPAFLLSAKYRERLKYLKIPYSIYDAFYGYFETAISSLFGQCTTLSKQQPSLELKSPHAGMLLFIIEGLAQNYWESSIKLPVNILTVDAEQRQTVSSMDRILDHYSSIFDNAPQTEYTKQLESEPNEKQVRVKFHPANLSYKLHYTPYDIISKLPTRYLHFFCALDSLQQEVDINFSKLHRKDEEHGHVIMECPFSCIMKNANYINAIERIVQEKKAMLNELTEMPPQKLLNLATSGCSVTIQTSNLLTLVRMLESFWREKEAPSDRKDLGKVSASSANIKSNKSVDWQQLCRDILDFNTNEEDNEKADEYEPTLNKEERIVRAQDVFVVNLPTLSFVASAKTSTDAERVLHNGVAVPKQMLETEVEREQVLKKLMSLSYWKYTDNTFETLRPQLAEYNFNAMEQEHLEEVYKFIEAHKLGANVIDLMREFPYEQFLLRSLHTLAEHNLIKRVGVATFMYVHKSYVRPWLVHTFHVTRLERENQGGTKPTSSSVSLKRKHSNVEDAEQEQTESTASTSKKVKLIQDAVESASVEQTSLGKRISKPVQRFEGEAESVTYKTDATRDVIVMKPQPWIRLNGSLNRRVLDKWLGSILTECIARSGCSVHDICVRFPHMLPVDIMCLLEVLTDLKCLNLTQIKEAEVDLFSEYENITESAVTELYNPQHTYVKAHADAVMRMAIFIGNKKYNAEFI